MFRYIANFFPALFSSKDKTVEEGVFFTFVALIGFIALAAVDLFYNTNAHFDPQGYGIGMGSLLGGSGVAAWGKGKMNAATPPGDTP